MSAPWPDLASRAYGGSVVAASDEFFAAKENLIKPGPAGHDPAGFGPRGHLYDGWETRRRRGPGGRLPAPGDHDWAVIALGLPGVIHRVVVDTAHFTGNHPAAVAVDAATATVPTAPPDLPALPWVEIVPRSPLGGDAAHTFPVRPERRFTHVRLRIFPDGGVARLRVLGEVVPDPEPVRGLSLDLAAMEHGGLVVTSSDGFYGSAANLIAPGPARGMGEGWETRRRREPGGEWVVLRLAGTGRIVLAELDTTHFLGNAPAAATLLGCDAAATDPADPAAWSPLLERAALLPDTRHRFRLDGGPQVTHVRLEIYPDGGMARLRLHGHLSPAGWAALTRRHAETTRADPPDPPARPATSHPPGR